MCTVRLRDCVEASDDGCLWSEAFADNMPVYEMKPDFLPHAFGIHPEWLST
jgi:hypothetical protein